MRSAYNDSIHTAVDRSSPSQSDSNSTRSFQTCSTYQTKATSYSGNIAAQQQQQQYQRPSHIRWSTCDGRNKDAPPAYFDDRQMQESPPTSPTCSVETYASTEAGDGDGAEREAEYDVPDYTARSILSSTALAATPSEFSELFPSSRRLDIRHDDSTLDGNMNLRVDTEVSVHGRRCPMSLFHLRLHDLQFREFSLRRYCRDSGREVCHSDTKRDKRKSEDKRPTFSRSMSNTFGKLRPQPERISSASAKLQRNDSGYGSMHSSDMEWDRASDPAQDVQSRHLPPSNSINLEFSNYANVEVHHRLASDRNIYEFDYWGKKYTWKPKVRREASGDERMFFRLRASDSKDTLAYIEPKVLAPEEAREELRSGGWVPPCTMQIVDQSITASGLARSDLDHAKHVADTIVATGLIALVDDLIRRLFDPEYPTVMRIPFTNMQFEYVGARKLLGEVMNRRDAESRPNSRPSTSGGSSTPLGAESGSSRRISLSRRQSGWG
jgi:hypothetical protein